LFFFIFSFVSRSRYSGENGLLVVTVGDLDTAAAPVHPPELKLSLADPQGFLPPSQRHFKTLA